MIDTALDTGAIHFPIAKIFLEIIEFAPPEDATCEILATDGLASIHDENSIPFNSLFEKLESGRRASETSTDDDDIKVGLIVHRITSGRPPYL